MFGLGTVALLSLAATAIGTGVSTYSAMQAGKAAKDQQKLKASQAAVEAQRERTAQVRQARSARAAILQAGASSGAESSSATTGAGGALAQSYSNIQGINSQEMSGKAQGNLQQKIINANGTASLGQGISSLGATVFNNREELSDIFGIKQA